MNKIHLLTIAVATACAMCLASCKKAELAKPEIEVSEASISFDAQGGEGRIAFKYTGPGTVSAQGDKDWVKLTGNSSSSISFSVEPNEGAFSRTATIRLSGSDVSSSVNLIQKGAIYELDFDGLTSRDIEGKTLGLDPAGIEPLRIDYKSTLSDEKPSVACNASWVKYSVEGKTLVITPDINLEEDRIAGLIVSLGWKSISFNVSQEYVKLFDGEDFHLTGDVKTGQIPYTENIGAIKNTWTVETESWIHATKGQTAIELTFDPNTGAEERHGKIAVIYEGKKIYSVAVFQQPVSAFVAVTFDIDRDAANLEIPGTEYYAALPQGWTVETESWVHATKGESGILLDVDENTSGSKRSGFIKVISEGKQIYSTTISQKTYSYKFLLGNWSVSANTVNNVNGFTLETNVEGESYRVSGIRSGDVFAKTIVYYMVINDVPHIRMSPQYLGQYSSTRWIWVCLHYLNNSTGAGTYTWGTSYHTDFVYNMDEANQKLILTDDGSREGYTCDGFYLYGFTDPVASSSTASGYYSRAYGGTVTLSR